MRERIKDVFFVIVGIGVAAIVVSSVYQFGFHQGAASERQWFVPEHTITQTVTVPASPAGTPQP